MSDDTTCEATCDPMLSDRERLIRQAWDLLEDARCSLADPGLARAWGRRRRDFLDAVIEYGLNS